MPIEKEVKKSRDLEDKEEIVDFLGPRLDAMRENRSKGVKSRKIKMEGEIEKYEEDQYCNFLDDDDDDEGHISSTYVARERERSSTNYFLSLRVINQEG